VWEPAVRRAAIEATPYDLPYAHIYTAAEHAPAASMTESLLAARTEPLGARCVGTVSTRSLALLDAREEGNHPMPFFLQTG
jgi:hypothetical protein